MVQHISRGDIPLFYLGQNYQGSLESMIASVFMLLPFPILWVLKISLLSSYILFVNLWMVLVRKFYGWRVGIITGLLIAFSPHFFTF